MSLALALVKSFFTTAGLFVIALSCVADNAASVKHGESVSSTAGESVAVSSGALSSIQNQVSSVSLIESSRESVDTVAVAPALSSSNQLSATGANGPAYTVQSNPRSPSQPPPKIGSGAHLLNVTLGLFLIIGLIFGISWFVRRFGQGTFTANTHMKIIATMPLGTRERLVLIDAGGQQLLLGITPTQINTLHVFESPIVATPGEANNSEFARKLMAILQRPTTGDQSTQKNSGQE